MALSCVPQMRHAASHMPPHAACCAANHATKRTQMLTNLCLCLSLGFGFGLYTHVGPVSPAHPRHSLLPARPGPDTGIFGICGTYKIHLLHYLYMCIVCVCVNDENEIKLNFRHKFKVKFISFFCVVYCGGYPCSMRNLKVFHSHIRSQSKGSRAKEFQCIWKSVSVSVRLWE